MCWWMLKGVPDLVKEDHKVFLWCDSYSGIQVYLSAVSMSLETNGAEK